MESVILRHHDIHTGQNMFFYFRWLFRRRMNDTSRNVRKEMRQHGGAPEFEALLIRGQLIEGIQ